RLGWPLLCRSQAPFPRVPAPAGSRAGGDKIRKASIETSKKTGLIARPYSKRRSHQDSFPHRSVKCLGPSGRVLDSDPPKRIPRDRAVQVATASQEDSSFP